MIPIGYWALQNTKKEKKEEPKEEIPIEHEPEPQDIIQVYDARLDQILDKGFFYSKNDSPQTWYEACAAAKKAGLTLPSSAEWYQMVRYLECNNTSEEKLIRSKTSWTRTLLDYTRNCIVEDFILTNDNGQFGIEVFDEDMTEKEKFFLPMCSSFVRDMPDKFTKTLLHLYGVEKREHIQKGAYVAVNKKVRDGGIYPVIRGGAGTSDKDNGATDVFIGFGPAAVKINYLMVDMRNSIPM